MAVTNVHVADVDMAYGALLVMQWLDTKNKLVRNTDDSQPTLYPHVEYTQETDIFDVHEFYVKADNVDVVCCSSIVNAITACFVTYWIFDIQYPKMFNNLLAFLDVRIFRKKSVCPTQKVLSFINRF